MGDPVSGLFRLSVAERVQLAEDLWDSIAAQPEDWPPLADTEREEIARRLADHAANPSSAIEWQDARARLWSRIG